jgi:murein DD-endopeptidase MepM/ murein hydrolase activator NlpD
VSKGTQIGTVGNTGNSTGPHLHFEVLYQGVRRNPYSYLP